MLCEGLLQLSPADRWTPRQALHHPFITGDSFEGTFAPPADRRAHPTTTGESTTRTTSTSPVATGSVPAMSMIAHVGVFCSVLLPTLVVVACFSV